MATKDPVKNRAYIAKSRQKFINSIGITEYRKRNAEAQRTFINSIGITEYRKRNAEAQRTKQLIK